jgi:UDP-N-acetylglucosamine transferase subunit ALG13
VRILVVVGSGAFDELVEHVDQLRRPEHSFTLQIGLGGYEPENHPWFRFADDLEPFYAPADLVISHGGMGTILECLHLGKKLIAVPNLHRKDQHQLEIVRELGRQRHLLYCPDASLIGTYLDRAATYPFVPYERPRCEIAQAIHDLIGDDTPPVPSATRAS